jgi:hypothetical protein
MLISFHFLHSSSTTNGAFMALTVKSAPVFQKIWQRSVANRESGLEVNDDKTKYMVQLKSGNDYYHLM